MPAGGAPCPPGGGPYGLGAGAAAGGPNPPPACGPPGGGPKPPPCGAPGGGPKPPPGGGPKPPPACGPPGGGAPCGCGAPIEGGATPSMVPFNWGRGAAAGRGPTAGGAAPGAGIACPGGGAPGAGAGAPGRRPAGAFIISIVPLNFGAAAPFRLNPHFLQVVAASSFSVPQFGQNTRSTSLRGLRGPRAYSASLRFLKGHVGLSPRARKRAPRPVPWFARAPAPTARSWPQCPFRHEYGHGHAHGGQALTPRFADHYGSPRRPGPRANS